MKIRVLRLIEYIYEDVETMQSDMSHWQVQGQYNPNNRMSIRSAVLPMDIMDDIAFPVGQVVTDEAGRQA